MGMDSVFRVSLVLDMVDNMTSKVQGAADGVPSAVQKMNDAFGTMQKAGVAMTGMGIRHRRSLHGYRDSDV